MAAATPPVAQDLILMDYRKPMMFDDVIEFARSEHAQFVEELRASENLTEDEPMSHLFLYDLAGKLEVFALLVTKEPNLLEFLRNFRAAIQAKILLEGIQAAVFCGIVFKSTAPTPEIRRLIEEKRKVDPDFLETLEQEIGLQTRLSVLATAENGRDSFTLEQEYFVRDNRAVCSEAPIETRGKGLPRLEYCNFQWPRSKAKGVM